MPLAAFSSAALCQTQLPPLTVTPAPAKKSPPKKTSGPKNSPAPSDVTDGTPNTGSGPVVAPSLASQLTVPGNELNARPVTRPGEILEAAPGLIVTQHSGEGKANQYFLRGYNLDHGTDMAIFVDDMPINMRTHAHGQGYADLNWLMPETVNSVAIRKGPFFADEGDFGSDATVKLVTNAVSTMAADKSIGRSDALQRSMLAMIDSGDAKEAHPAYWAPFVVVGEGSSPSAPLATSSTVPGPEAHAPAKAQVPPKKKPTVTDWRKEIWRQ